MTTQTLVEPAEDSANIGIPTNATRRDSLAGCESSSRASPPAAGTAQMSPPEMNAISLRSGDMVGSVK